MRDDTAISVKNISKSFRLPHEKHNSLKDKAVHIFGPRKFTKLKVLEDIHFEVKKGEFFGIVGKNGSGKSTLLKILANIYQPTTGRVEINGSLAPFIELGVGFNPDLTGRENVFLSGTILGLTKKKIESIYDDIVSFAEIEEFMDQKLKNYSSGMQVRLAFSIAVRAESDILLIDEVLAVGDAAFQAKCFDYFYKLKESAKTIVFISHDMEAIKKFCDRAAYIKDGNISIIGKTKEIADQYSIDNYQSLQSESNKQKNQKRSNNKPVYISDYRVRSEIIKKNDPIDIVIEIDSKEEQELILGIAIIREDGVVAVELNSSLDLKNLKTNKGRNIFKCKIEPYQLVAGRYILNVAIFNPNGFMLIDALSDQAHFKVMSQDSSKGGVFNVNGSWEFIE